MSSLARLLNAAANAADLQFALDVGLKATVLLLAAAAASALLRRSSAALRHRVWCLTFAALVLLPGLSAALPKWRLPILPRAEEGVVASEAAIAAEPPPAEFAADAAPLAPPIEPAFFDERPAQGEPQPEAFAAAPSPSPAIVPAESETPPSASAAAWQLPGLATIWLAGAGLALAPLAIGLARMFVLRRQSRAVDCAVWTGLVDEVRARLGLARRVALLETRRAVMPMTWGLVRPAVLLPSQAREWSERLRRIVLLHELAHVKRYDVGFQLLGRLTCSLYWFHPLAWYALRRLRIERELACDDCVVHSGELASDYAAELLQIARTYQPVRLAAAIAMAQRSSLEHRIRAMFDRACSHLPLSGRAARLLLAGVIVFVTTLAAVRLAPRAAAEDDQSEPPIAESSEATPSSGASSEQADEDAKADDAAGAERRLAVRVADAAGKPVAGARVRVIQYDTRPAWVEKVHAVGEARTNAAGAATVAYPVVAPFAADGAFVAPTFFVLAEAEGYAIDWSHVPSDGDVTIALSREDVPVEGRVLDLEGRPRSGVRVSINSIQGDAENLEAWIEAAKRNPTVVDPVKLAEGTELQVSPYRGQKQISLGSESVLPAAITDAQGRFRLTGLGRDRMLTLELTGEGMAKTWLNVLTRDMAPLPYSEWGDPRFRAQTCFGAKFDLTTEPDQSIVGVVRDAESGQPLPGVEVRLNQYAATTTVVEGFLSATTDTQGRYALRGVPKPHDRERGHILRLVPSADLPYFRTEFEVARQDGLDAVTCDMTLKRAIWLRGRITNAKTGQPIRGLVEYYPFVSNQAASDYRNFVPGMRMLEGERYATADDGSYRLPALPGRGLLAFTAREADRYPQSDGVETITGLHQDGGRLNVYHLSSLDMATALREVNPPAEAVDAVCDIGLRSLDVAQVKLVDPEGRALEGTVAQRLAPYRYGGSHSIGWPQEPLLDSTVVLIGPREQSRTVMFLHRERQLAAAVRLSRDREPPKTIVLRRCATLAGRVVDREGKPIGELGISIAAAPEPGAKPPAGWAPESIYYTHQLENLATGPDGAFRIENVPPGAAYVIYARRGAERLEATTAVVQPGDSLALGDVVLEEPKAGGKEQASVAAAKPEPAAVASGDAAKPDETKAAKASPKNTGSPTTLRGRVTFGGRPAGGAHVAAVAQRTSAERGGDFKPSGEVLAETVADDKGEYALSLTNISSKTHAYANVIARKEGAAIAWRPLNLDAVETVASLELAAEAPIRGKLIDLEGRPAAGVRLVISAVLEHKESGMPNDGVGDHTSEFATAAWPPAVTSDKQGRFVIHGIHAGRGVMLNVEANDRFAPQDIALNAGWPEQRGELDATYRPLVKNAKPGEEAVLALAPAQPFKGVVRYADSGKPAPHARITIGASQQEFGGSMILVAGSADELGRYRIVPKPGVRFGLTVYPPAEVPYLARQTPFSEPIRWKASDQVKQVDFNLPRGVLVRGKVVEAHGEAPVVGAAIQYIPESKNNSNDSEDIITRWQAIQLSDDQGQFTIAVLPGPGRLLAHGPQGKYVLQEVGSHEIYEGRPGGQRSYAHAVAKIDAQPGQDVPEVKFELKPGARATGRIVDEQGKAIEEATVISRLSISPYSLYWRGHATPSMGGRFELTGLAKDAEYPVYFLHSKRRIGAAEIIRPGERERIVVLKPCGGAALRLVDDKGEAAAEQHVTVEMVVTPGASRYDFDAARRGELTADADFLSNIDRANHDIQPRSDEQGRIRLSALIPGASYRVTAMRDRRLQVVKEFQAQSDATLDLGDVVIERSE